MARNDIMEHILEQAAIAASTALVELVGNAVESMLSSVIGRNERTSARIDEVIDRISASLIDLVSEKIRESIKLGDDNDEEYLDESPEADEEIIEDIDEDIDEDESEQSISDRIASILSKGGMVQRELDQEPRTETGRGFRRDNAKDRDKPASESIKDIAEKLRGLGSERDRGGFLNRGDNSKRDHVAMKSLENILQNRLKRR